MSYAVEIHFLFNRKDRRDLSIRTEPTDAIFSIGGNLG